MTAQAKHTSAGAPCSPHPASGVIITFRSPGCAAARCLLMASTRRRAALASIQSCSPLGAGVHISSQCLTDTRGACKEAQERAHASQPAGSHYMNVMGTSRAAMRSSSGARGLQHSAGVSVSV